MEFSDYITGFVDGEGTFNVSFSERKKLRVGVEVKPSFSVSQHKRNLKVLEEIRDYFGVGSIRFSRRDQNYKYEVRSIKDLVEKIIPNFKRYPLRTTKVKDFEIFSEICELVRSNHHLNRDYLKLIIDKAYQMNAGGKRKYNKEELLKLIAR